MTAILSFEFTLQAVLRYLRVYAISSVLLIGRSQNNINPITFSQLLTSPISKFVETCKILEIAK